MDKRRIAARLMKLEDRLDLALEVLRSQSKKMEKLMSLVNDLKEGLKKVGDSISRVSNRWDELIAQLRNKSLTDAEETEVLNTMQELSDHLDAVGQNPTSPPEPPASLTKKK